MPWKKITTITEAAFEQEAGSSIIDVSDKVRTRRWTPTKEEQEVINQRMRDSLTVYRQAICKADRCFEFLKPSADGVTPDFCERHQAIADAAQTDQ